MAKKSGVPPPNTTPKNPTKASGIVPPSPPPPPPSPSPSLPPRPPTPGVGASAASFKATVLNSGFYRYGKVGYAWKRSIFFVLGTTYGLYNYQSTKIKARERDHIHDNTYLYWKIYDGAIVEAKSTGSGLNYLLNSSQGGSPEEPPRVLTLFEVIRTIKFIEADDRIRGLVADFSKISVPSVPSYSLGLAQLEEIQDALLELRRTKREKFGKDGWRTVAWTDTFNSQGQYLFATAFDEVYTQPTGGIPLVGMSSTIPFYGRLAKWLGIEVYAEARNEYKSFVQPYIDEKFTDPQRANKEELMNDLNDNLMTYIARNRFPLEMGRAGLEKVKELSKDGPYTSREAVKIGLLNGLNYRQDILDSVMEKEKGGDPERKMKGFYHYSKVVEQAAKDAPENTVVDIGVVYLQGTIGDSGEFGTAAVVRGLKEAGEDDSIGAVVLRIDSGGGGVVESDTIWGAVRDLKEKHGKTVIASFGNASASGGYLVSTHVDAIMAAPSTITGSIGVASLRPTVTKLFFDRIHIAVESCFLGSKVMDPTHSLTPAEKARSSAQVDEMYLDFKNRVVEGRGIHPEVIDLIAGGRVMTGLTAFALNAPAELIRQIKGLGSEEPLVVLPSDVLAIEPSSTSEIIPVAVISEDQATSPFAPPETIETIISSEPILSTALESAPVSTPAFTSTISSDLPVSLDVITLSSNEEGSVLGKVAGEYEVVAGPFGRGLIDGLGGIRDAAVYACEVYLAKGISEYKVDNPLKSEEDALRSLLPNAILKNSGEGLALQIDVQLKRFPVQKSFFQQFKEQSSKGDSMDVTALTSHLKLSVLNWMVSVVSKWASSEIDNFSFIGTAKNQFAKRSSSSNNDLRAEMTGYNIR